MKMAHTSPTALRSLAVILRVTQEEEAREMIADAIALYIDLLHDRGEEIPADVHVTTVRIVV